MELAKEGGCGRGQHRGSGGLSSPEMLQRPSGATGMRGLKF